MPKSKLVGDLNIDAHGRNCSKIFMERVELFEQDTGVEISAVVKRDQFQLAPSDMDDWDGLPELEDFLTGLEKEEIIEPGWSWDFFDE